MRFRITNTPPGLESNFTVNENTGEISLTDMLDYENIDRSLHGSVTLEIEAYDLGSPSKSTRINVTLEVEVSYHAILDSLKNLFLIL